MDKSNDAIVFAYNVFFTVAIMFGLMAAYDATLGTGVGLGTLHRSVLCPMALIASWGALCFVFTGTEAMVFALGWMIFVHLNGYKSGTPKWRVALEYVKLPWNILKAWWARMTGNASVTVATGENWRWKPYFKYERINGNPHPK